MTIGRVILYLTGCKIHDVQPKASLFRRGRQRIVPKGQAHVQGLQSVQKSLLLLIKVQIRDVLVDAAVIIA